MKFTPYEYQKRAIKKIMTQPSVGLFLEMGRSSASSMTSST